MKKQPLLILSGFLLLFSVLSSCSDSCEKGSGKAASEDRKLDASFTKLNISGAYKIVLKQGDPSVKVTADDNLLKVIKTSVSGDELTIKNTKDVCNGTMEVDISNPDFRAIKSSAALDISSNGKLNLKDFDMEFAGAAKAKLDLNAAHVKIKTSGAADINLTGQATENEVTMSGAGNLNALDFVVANYRIESSGITHCKINVLQELSVNISGTGGLEYKGNPSKISNEHSGFTSIKKIE